MKNRREKALLERIEAKKRIANASKAVMDKLSEYVLYNPMKPIDGEPEEGVFCGSIKDMQKGSK